MIHFCGENSFTHKIKKMNSTNLKDIWNEQKRRLKQKFAWLTDTDFLFKPGKKKEMLDKLQVKLGKNGVELQKIISSR